MTMPLVSIGLPAFKAKFFKEALESIKSQTYTNFEVLIQDDASPEDLRSVVDEVCGGDSRFQYERNETNSSPNFVRNWNKTLARSKGEFFVLASDDDIYLPEFLSQLVKLAEKYQTVNLFFSPFVVFNGEKITEVTNRSPVYESQIEYAYGLICGSRHTIVPNYLIRSDALRQMGGFVDLPAAWGADWLTWCMLAKNGVVCSHERLFKWRCDGNNISSIDSPFWAHQKMNALFIQRALWKEIVSRMNPANEAEATMLHRIRYNKVDNYVASTIEPNLIRGRFYPYASYLWKQRRSYLIVGSLRWLQYHFEVKAIGFKRRIFDR